MTALTPREPSLGLGVGGRAPLPVTRAACSARGDSSLVYAVSDPRVATVDSVGVVTAVAPGETTVTVAMRAAASRRRVVRVSVALSTGFPVSLTVHPTAVTLAPGDSAVLGVVIPLSPGAPPGMSRAAGFASSDTTVATVSAAGVIRGRRPGQAVVTVFAMVQPSVTQAVAVTVTAP